MDEILTRLAKLCADLVKLTADVEALSKCSVSADQGEEVPIGCHVWLRGHYEIRKRNARSGVAIERGDNTVLERLVLRRGNYVSEGELITALVGNDCYVSSVRNRINRVRRALETDKEMIVNKKCVGWMLRKEPI